MRGQRREEGERREMDPENMREQRREKEDRRDPEWDRGQRKEIDEKREKGKWKYEERDRRYGKIETREGSRNIQTEKLDKNNYQNKIKAFFLVNKHKKKIFNLF